MKMKIADQSGHKSRRVTFAVYLALVGAIAWAFGVDANQAPRERAISASEIDRAFSRDVRPFLDKYCTSCHGVNGTAAQFDLRPYANTASVVKDFAHWQLVLDKLREAQMPPPQARQQPSAEERKLVISWIESVRREEARRNAGDPGLVLARRLSNAEYNNSIRDLTGVDLRPAREFPVDPANQAGFDNSGESLAMSPNLLAKYLQAAREVANAVVFKPRALGFAPHPMLVETDRDRYAVSQIIEFYKRQNTELSDYFQAAWQYKHRAALGQPKATLAEIATESGVSPKYLATVWRTLEGTKEEIGPIAQLQTMWRELPVPPALGKRQQVEAEIKAGANKMRDYAVQLRKQIAFKYTPIQVKGLSATAQPFLMWRNKQYALNRMSFNRAALPVAGDEVPAAQRTRYEAAFERFAAVFPDAFYVSERGRYFPDNTRDTGRHLSAGFHNVMGYFRDDKPLYELILDEKGQKELDAVWQELDFVALGLTRTFIQFFLNESGEARGLRREAEGPRPADKEITSEAVVNQLAEAYRNRVRQANDPMALKAIDEHFTWVNANLRWVEQAKIDAEPTHLNALLDFAARAWRRPLPQTETADLLRYYRTLREKDGLGHEDAIRDSIVMVLVSPDFCYRIDLVGADSKANNKFVPLSDFALASRLSYFLWSSMPDAELMAVAARGELKRPEMLARQARRMLKDERVRGLATEFSGNWLDFRRFEELNTVDRERFPMFDNDLRQAMYEEPLRFMLDVFRGNGSVLDLLYANHTFVNPVLARHYGIPNVSGNRNIWVRVDDANKYERGGLLPMAAFLTKNAPGLRTSPVKRGYWVVKQVLGEHIPPPPAVVPELPRDEAKLDLPLRDLLARHRENPSCASCHARFDSLGLVFEGFGPVGERRVKDLSGRAIDASATFPGGTTGSGIEGLKTYLRAQRQSDFIDNLCRKLLAYALGRSLILSDDILIKSMRANLERDGYRFDSLIESIVTSSQFRNKRGGDDLSRRSTLLR
jgi:mono/diheme cytochrome c family protein